MPYKAAYSEDMRLISTSCNKLVDLVCEFGREAKAPMLGILHQFNSLLHVTNAIGNEVLRYLADRPTKRNSL